MSTRGRSGRSRAVTALASVLAVTVLAGCVADPPPPTVVGEETSDGESVSRSSNGILLALDRIDEGFNPHLLVDQGVDTDLVASLVLPSAYVPGPSGDRELNRAVLTSAGPLPADPRTVRYAIHPQAQWSDGVPVAAEDFEYLWRQMTSQPGVVDPAGYERIVDVRSGAGGKVVDVIFASSPGRWESLFDNLLPGHLLKDAPNGFQGAMRQLPAASAGPFMIRVADLGRGEIELVRNDRYWSDSPSLDQILVRRATGVGQLGAALRDGPGSMTLSARSPVITDVTETVPDVRSEVLAAASQLELALNTVSPTGSDQAVRRAVVAAVRPDVVGRIVTGEADPQSTPFPFPEGETTPEGSRAVSEILTSAGFSRPGERWIRDGTTLSLTLGVEAADDGAVNAAYTLVDQLRVVGVGARVWELDPVALYADALPHGLVDGVVGWQRVDGDAMTAAVSRYACSSSGAPGTAGTTGPIRPATTVPTLVPPAPDTGGTTTVTTPDTATSTPTPPRRTIGTTAPARASGVTGVCDAELQRILGGGGPESAVDLEAAGYRVDQQALRVPLVRPRLLLAGDGAQWVGQGATERPTRFAPDAPRLVTDVFDAAPTWRRTG